MNDHTDRHSGRHMAARVADRPLPGQQIASLSNRLAPRKSPGAKSSQDQNANEESPSVAPAGDRRAPETPRGQRPRATRDVTRNVALSLDIGTQEALRRAARKAETSQAEVIYEALERYVATGGKAVVEPVPADTLFQRAIAPASTGPRAVHTLRLPSRNVEVIDQLVTQTGHPSRSALVEAALDAHLGDPGDA